MPLSPWEDIDQLVRRRLAVNVRALRRARGLSMEAAAHDVMSWRQWQRIESEEHSITLRTLAKLAWALEVDPADLLR